MGGFSLRAWNSISAAGRSASQERRAALQARRRLAISASAALERESRLLMSKYLT
jgi:hypothetical protein